MKYECEIKVDGKWFFVGWCEIKRETPFEIEYKETKKFIYQKNKYLNGDIEEYRFRKQNNIFQSI